MAGDLRRVEGGKFFLDIAKYILTATAVSSLITERMNLVVGFAGLAVGAMVGIVGYFILPSEKEDAR